MRSLIRRSSATTALLVGSLAIASAAQAGGFAGDACVGKKQAALGKYAASVGKAYGTTDPTDRAEKIAKAATANTPTDATAPATPDGCRYWASVAER